MRHCAVFPFVFSASHPLSLAQCCFGRGCPSPCCRRCRCRCRSSRFATTARADPPSAPSSLPTRASAQWTSACRSFPCTGTRCSGCGSGCGCSWRPSCAPAKRSPLTPSPPAAAGLFPVAADLCCQYPGDHGRGRPHAGPPPLRRLLCALPGGGRCAGFVMTPQVRALAAAAS